MDYLLLVFHFRWYNPGLNDELWEQAFNVLLLARLIHVYCFNRISLFSSYFFPVCWFLSLMWNIVLVFFIWNKNISSSQHKLFDQPSDRKAL